MYNAHRGMVQPPSSSNNRLSELFDQIRREFDTHSQERAGEHDQNSEFVCFYLVLYRKFGTCTSPLLRHRQTQTLRPLLSLCLWQDVARERRTRELASMGTKKEVMRLRQLLTEFQNTVAAQMQEMELVRQKVYELERQQLNIKARYVIDGFGIIHQVGS